MKVEFTPEDLEELNKFLFAIDPTRIDFSSSYPTQKVKEQICKNAVEFRNILEELQFDCRTIQKIMFHGDIVSMIKAIAEQSKEKRKTKTMLLEVLHNYLDIESSDDIITISYNEDSDVTTVTYYVE